jgi:transitional endoplasmic reticulum ATPase
MDGVVKNDRVFVIGATNRIDAVDPAVKRRLRLWVPVPLPDNIALTEILEAGGIPREHAQETAKACHTRGFSGSDARQLCAMARVEAAMNNSGSEITPEHVSRAMERF